MIFGCSRRDWHHEEIVTISVIVVLYCTVRFKDGRCHGFVTKDSLRSFFWQWHEARPTLSGAAQNGQCLTSKYRESIRTHRNHGNHLFSYRSRGTLMSYTDHSMQRRLKFFFFSEILFLLRNTNVTEHMPRKRSQEFKDSQTIHSNYKKK